MEPGEKNMSLFDKQPGQSQLQQGLNRDRERQQTDQAPEHHQDQTPEPQKPIFRKAKKDFVVDLAGGWERP
jgi:hypothetical protein